MITDFMTIKATKALAAKKARGEKKIGPPGKSR